MEQITIEIRGPRIVKIDAEQMQRQREATDEAARQASIRLMAKKPARLTQPENKPLDSRPAVTLRELSERLKMDRSACRRYVLGMGYEPTRKRTPDSGYQIALTFTAQQADEIFAKRRADGYC